MSRNRQIAIMANSCVCCCCCMPASAGMEGLSS